mmetsp:Transcript_113601/g.367477  ORF Transcript_113601/g.367477 Transcript_113601/m.367477 type:complete len:114 (+) Transcript_113601:418-759(+)
MPMSTINYITTTTSLFQSSDRNQSKGERRRNGCAMRTKASADEDLDLLFVAERVGEEIDAHKNACSNLLFEPCDASENDHGTKQGERTCTREAPDPRKCLGQRSLSQRGLSWW